MNKDPKVFLRHILESIVLIESYLAGVSKKEFLMTPQLQDSVIRRIEIIGEAVKNLPVDWRADYPQIPWQKIAGMRDVLIHQYFGVDMELTWRVAKRELPKLKREIARLLQQLEG